MYCIYVYPLLHLLNPLTQAEPPTCDIEVNPVICYTIRYLPGVACDVL